MTISTGRGRGGQNKISIAEHLARGTFRKGRHRERFKQERPSGPRAVRVDSNGDPIDERIVVTPRQRRTFLKGMPTVARRVAEEALDTYWDWPSSALNMLRSYALSMQRVSELEAAKRPNRAAIRTETLTAQRLRLALKLT